MKVLYVDRDLLVIDKPAGLAVHPGPQTPRSLEDHLPELRMGLNRDPVPVHRLDRDTSGCLVLARHRTSIRWLTSLFETHKIHKTYWAICEGAPEADSGTIDQPLLKVSTAEDGWSVIVDPRGKPARTRWTVRQRFESQCWIEFHPETGRTHQIRVHAKWLGCPVVGDPFYGTGDGLMLHAREIRIPGPTEIVVTADPPETWNPFLAMVAKEATIAKDHL